VPRKVAICMGHRSPIDERIIVFTDNQEMESSCSRFVMLWHTLEHLLLRPSMTSTPVQV
jgi:hypothetical protein